MCTVARIHLTCNIRAKAKKMLKINNGNKCFLYMLLIFNILNIQTVSTIFINNLLFYSRNLKLINFEYFAKIKPNSQ